MTRVLFPDCAVAGGGPQHRPMRHATENSKFTTASLLKVQSEPLTSRRRRHSACVEGECTDVLVPPEPHHTAAPLPHRSGLKVLVDLRDVLHDALPVRPVGPHELLDVLFKTVTGGGSKLWKEKEHMTNVMSVNNIDPQNDIIPICPISLSRVQHLQEVDHIRHSDKTQSDIIHLLKLH